jgi:RNA polymerase sigma factor (sigma-70 family)
MSQPSPSDDQSLLERCRAGDATAWEALVRRYDRLVYAIARRAGLDEQSAADVFQTVFMRLMQNLQRIAEPARLQAWIVTTTKRESLLQRRRGQGAAPNDGWEAALADEALGPQDTLEYWQQLNRVRLALERMEPRCRRLLQILFTHEAAGYDQAARELGMPVGSIGPTRARCLAKLRRSLD